MPLATRRFLQASFICLVAAMAVNLLIAISPFIRMGINGLQPIYFHLFLVGWATNLIIGVVNWMFPKKSREMPRGTEMATWWVFVLLNGGLLLRVFTEPAASSAATTALQVSIVASALSQWAAVVIFVVNTWPRIKER